MPTFDAIALAREFEKNGIVELDQPGERLPPGQRGRAAAFSLNVVVAMWLAGIGDELSPWLDKVVDWLDRDNADLGTRDPDGPFDLLRRYRALAIVRWLQHRNDPGLWQKAAIASRQISFPADPEDQAEIVPLEGPVIAGRSGQNCGAWLSSLNQPDRADGPSIADVGNWFSENAPAWLARGAYVQLAAWLHYGVKPITEDPAAALNIARFMVPDLRQERIKHDRDGGRDKQRNATVVDPGGVESFEPLLFLIGLSRDADAVPQGGTPEFASWTRYQGLSLEVDWHACKGEAARLEIRGTGAGRLASLITETVGGKVAGDPEAALAELLTVPSRSAPASAAAAEARWEILCATVLDEHALEQMGGRALVRAGLADSDWRVRMAAVWAIGHFRLAGLARETEAAALPKSGFSGLSQDDRRVLLAMRDLAAARSAGRPETGRMGANAGFVSRIAALLDKLPARPGDRTEMLLTALLRRGDPDMSRIPSAWKPWMAIDYR